MNGTELVCDITASPIAKLANCENSRKLLSNNQINFRVEIWILLSNFRVDPRNGVAYIKKQRVSTIYTIHRYIKKQ